MAPARAQHIPQSTPTNTAEDAMIQDTITHITRRGDSDPDFISYSPDPNTTVEILTSVSVVGWLLFGLISILIINGRGRAGWWVPEWYLDSKGQRRDQLALVGWWAAVMLFWPVIWPTVAVRKIGEGLRKGWKGMKRWRAKEEENCDVEEV